MNKEIEEMIDRLKAENKRLSQELGQILLSIDTVKEMNAMCNIDEQRKQAVKEFAERIKGKALSHCKTINCYELTFIEETIDDLLKEYEK